MNSGRSEYVRPNENIEDRVARLYRRMESPVLTDVKFDFVRDEAKTEDGPVVNRAVRAMHSTCSRANSS